MLLTRKMKAKKLFISKISSDGSNLIYSTFLGGSNFNDYVSGLSVNSSGNAYLTGLTQSSDFPVTENAYDKTLNGYSDCFLTKINPDGSNLVFSTFMGGTNTLSSLDFANDLTLDKDNNIYLLGTAGASDFPISQGAIDISGRSFIAKFNADGNMLYSTRIEGSNGDNISYRKIFIDSNNIVYLAGDTLDKTFPTTSGSYDTTFNSPGYWDGHMSMPGYTDVFLCKFDFTDITSVETEKSIKPSEIEIKSVYPNPFNPSTTIEYSLNKNSYINLSIYNVAGQKIREIISDEMINGKHNVIWDGMNDKGKIVSSGVYLVNLKSENYSVSKKIQLIK